MEKEPGANRFWRAPEGVMQGCQDGIRAKRGFDLKTNIVDFGVILCLREGFFRGYSFKKIRETNPVNWLTRGGEGVEAEFYCLMYFVQMFHVEQGSREEEGVARGKMALWEKGGVPSPQPSPRTGEGERGTLSQDGRGCKRDSLPRCRLLSNRQVPYPPCLNRFSLPYLVPLVGSSGGKIASLGRLATSQATTPSLYFSHASRAFRSNSSSSSPRTRPPSTTTFPPHQHRVAVLARRDVNQGPHRIVDGRVVESVEVEDADVRRAAGSQPS